MSGRIPRFFVGFVAYATALGTLSALAIVATPSVASAAVFAVLNGDDSGTGSLRNALALASNNPGPDTVNIANEVATITLTTGELFYFGNDDLTVNGGNGAAIQQNTLDAGVMQPTTGTCSGSLTLSALTIQGANGSGGPAVQACNHLTLSGAVVQNNNVATSVAGVLANTVSITNSTITNNVATSVAGVDANTISITNSTITNNVVTSVGISQNAGGVIGTNVTITDSTIENNSATSDGADGAGGVLARNTLSITNSTVADNDAVNTGGAGSVASVAGGALGYGNGGSNVTVTGSTVSGNTATDSGTGSATGGVALVIPIVGGNPFTSVTLGNSTVAGNTATSSGTGTTTGGVNGAAVTLSHTTVVQNTAGASGAANVRTAVGPGTGNVMLTGSVIAQPLGGGPNCIIDPAGSSSSLANFSDDASEVESCKLAHPSNNIGAGNDPQLGALAANGGLTKTMLPGASVMNSVFIPTCGATPADQRGVTRPQGSSCDIGAVEFVVPGAPTGVSGVAGTAQVSVSWVAPGVVGDGPITGYLVIATPGDGTCAWTAGPLSCVVTGLTGGQAYTFAVTASNAGGAGPASAPSGPVTPTAPTVPGRPTGAVAVAGDTDATVTWVAPVSDGGSPITSYTVTSVPEDLTCGWTTGPLNCTVKSLTNGQPYHFVVTATNAAGTSGDSVDSNTVTPSAGMAGTLTSLTPARILDTRPGGTGLAGAFAPQQTRDLPVLNVGGVPAAGVDAVLINVTATGSSAGGWLTLFPAGASVPEATSVNFGPGQTVATLVVVKVGVGGAVSINNTGGNPSASAVHVIGDVVGWYSDATSPDAGRFTGVTPSRVLDTRSNVGLTGGFGPQQTRNLTVGGTGGVPVDADAVVINMTSVSPSAGGWLTLFPNGQPLPVASSLNFGPGETIANLVTVKLGPGGVVAINNTGGNPSAGSLHAVGDVVGFYKNGTASRLTTIVPERILDTRSSGAVAPQGNVTVDPQLSAAVPDVGEYTAVVVHVTATGPGAVGWLTAYPSDVGVPLAATLNFVPGQTIANLAKIKVGPDGRFKINNSGGNPSAGFVHVIVDIVGYYE